jgi:hypothetical protein
VQWAQLPVGVPAPPAGLGATPQPWAETPPTMERTLQESLDWRALR